MKGRPLPAPVLAVLLALLAVPLVVAPARAQLTAEEEDVRAFGDATFHGSTGAIDLARPLVGMAATDTDDGYWLVAADGGVFTFGDAGFFGSTGGMALNRPVVGMAATDTDDGYWLAAADGGVFAFGDAGFVGSAAAFRLNRPVVGMAATPSGDGYWLVASDGGVFAFGDAGFFGSTGSIALNQPVVGMAATPSGDGYWLVAADGGVFTFGDAGFFGSAAAPDGYRRFVGMAATSTGGGYWLASSGACAFGRGDGDVSFRPDSHIMQLTDVRTGRHECFERVVFDFQVELGTPNGTLSYQVGYGTPPFAGTSGYPEAIEGGAFLEVVVFGARTYDGNTAEPTYTGPDELLPGFPAIREVQLVDDFEATMAWVIGLDRRRAFNVFQLDSPDRLVVDIGPPTTPAPPATAVVQAFFTPETSLETRCDVVVEAPRTVPGATPLTFAILELLEGPSVVEAAAGLVSPFSDETATLLNGVAIRNRTAHVDFVDFSQIIPNASTSCGSAQLLAQLDATVTQFPTVDSAIYSFDGDVGAFYEWLQLEPPA